MINVSDIVIDPDFAQQFLIERPTGGFDHEGVYEPGQPAVLGRIGTIVPGVSKDIVQLLPEGVRVNNTISVFSNEDILLGDGETIMPDVVVWKGNRYTVVFDSPYSDYGYWYVVAEIIAGA